MQIWSTNSGWFQIFKYEGGLFINWQNSKVLDVVGGKDVEGQKVGVWGNHKGRNQRWRVLYVERDFYVVSALPDKRYLDLINNRNMVIKVQNGRNTQRWYFHQQSLTIRTRLNN
jgi:hypothetical protein